jgi:hypothetical protein
MPSPGIARLVRVRTSLATVARNNPREGGPAENPSVGRKASCGVHERLLGKIRIAPGQVQIDTTHFARLLPNQPFQSERPSTGRRVFLTENEVNCLAFPDLAEAIVVFGKGYGADLLHSASWMSGRHIYYWGDIDTHGFAILDRLRARFPNVRSFLMNRETLMAHRSLWVREDAPCRTALSRLDHDEQALFDDLVHDRLGENVRLEQEPVSFALLKKTLRTIASYA